MPKHPDAPQVYEVMNLFAERCLRSNGSLLWDDSEVWTEEHPSLLIERLVKEPDESDRSFWEKLAEQLRDLPTPCNCLGR